MRFRKALDSGAFSLFNKYSKNRHDQRGGSDFSFYDSPKFIDYLDKWVAYVKELEGVEYFVTVDVIFNPERTYDLWQQFRKMGLNPLPVVHFGEDVKWLDKYLDECDYVCFGGLGSRAGNVRQYDEWADTMFGRITGPDGKPTHKVHGLALTQYDLLLRYPWYSVDSTTAFRASNNGMIQVPQAHVVSGKIKFDYLGRSYWFPCTERRARASSHVSKSGQWYDKVVKAYLDQFGFTLEEASESYFVRNVVSLLYYLQLEKALAEWRGFPFIYYASGKASGFSEDTADDFFSAIDRVGDFSYNFLGTFFDVRTYETITSTMEAYHAKRSTSKSSETRGTGTTHPRLHSGAHPRLLRRR
ncbi:MAG: hypothetical protein ABIN58_00995 [candidate division WOR-3 bacterium]